MQTFTFYSDPSHGWLCVTREQMDAARLNPLHFSKYSYRRDSTREYFLEEDCDAPKFLTAWKALHGEPTIQERSTDARSFVRSLRPIV